MARTKKIETDKDTKPVKKERKHRRVMNNVSDIERYSNNINPLSLFGASAMTFPDKISPVRSVMATRHTSQRVVITNPEFPMMYTGAENEFGDRSSWNIKAKDDYQLLKTFRKFKDYPNSVVAYFFKNLRTGKIKCEIVEPAVNLIEKYGFRMSNKIRDYVEGDIIPKGTPISQSSSYVDDNYCAGRNIRIAYTILPELTEDALVISDYAAEQLRYDMVDVVNVDLKKDSFLLNKYGNDRNYKPFPDIGEEIKNGVVCSIRENSYVSSLAEASVSHINDRDIISKGTVVDIDIFTNVDVENDQLNYYLQQIRDWYSDIYAYISTIVVDPSQNDTTLLDIYHKAEKYLNNATWVVKEKIVDTIVRFKVLQPKEIRPGQKVVGRYGNKSVITKIVPREEMPRTDDGRPIDMLANGLAVPNRIIAFATYECSLTFQSERMYQHLIKMADEGKSRDEIVALAIEFVSTYNPEEGAELERLYHEDPKTVYDDIIRNGIFIQIMPLNSKCTRDAIIECYEKWPDIMKQYGINVKLGHRRVDIDGEYAIGYQYTWVLKQEPSKAMSVVATGRTTPYDLPVKTHQYNNNLRMYSDNPIKFGEYDTYNFLAGTGVREFMKLTTYYRGSQYEENSMLMAQLNNKKIDLTKYNKFPQLCNLRNVLKLIGVELTPNKFSFNSIGLIDKTYEVYINNVPVTVSIPDLSYALMMYSYYIQYEEYLKGAVIIDDFFRHIRETNLFYEKPNDYIDHVFDIFCQLLPLLQQLKQYE